MSFWRRPGAMLLAVCVAAACLWPVISAAEESEEATEAVSEVDSFADSELGTALQDYFDSADYIPEISVAEVESYLDLACELFRNEDFQSLMSYEEVRDLVDTLLQYAVKFAQDEPELTGKIMVTMGVAEGFEKPLVEMLANADSAMLAVKEIFSTREGQQMADFAQQLVEDEELRKAFAEMLVSVYKEIGK